MTNLARSTLKYIDTMLGPSSAVAELGLTRILNLPLFVISRLSCAKVNDCEMLGKSLIWKYIGYGDEQMIFEWYLDADYAVRQEGGSGKISVGQNVPKAFADYIRDVEFVPVLGGRFLPIS